MRSSQWGGTESFSRWLAEKDWNPEKSDKNQELIERIFEETRRYKEEPVSLDPDSIRSKMVNYAVQIALFRAHPGIYRIYETVGGLRLIRIDKELEPRSRESVSNHTHVKSDKRYQELCIYQNCYRARLTPKPWRRNNVKVGSERVGVAKYFGTCQVIGNYSDIDFPEYHWGEVLGNTPKIQNVVSYHDSITRANSNDLTYLA